MSNIFDSPKESLSEIYRVRIPQKKRKKYRGKTYLCAWITKLCPAKCENCFFKSNMNQVGDPAERNQFSEKGIDKLIQFVNDSNSGYLMLSGGGEPMIRKNAINKIIREAKTEKIVIVTSGLFARTYQKALDVINELYASYTSRAEDTKVILRISIDSFHYEPLGFEILKNIVLVYKEHYRNTPNFELQIHTMIGDPTLNNFVNYLGDCTIQDEDKVLLSDNNVVIKIIPKQINVLFNDGYNIRVSCSKLFFSNLKIDLTALTPEVKSALDVFEADMTDSEYGNPSIITNSDGSLGYDFWIDYNGNTTTWGNQQWDNLYNLYTDSYEEIIERTLDNIISYSFLEKGYYYRERIIRTINPKAALRSKAINLRDYSGAFLLEEERTKLYYGIRVIKDYLDEGVLQDEDIEVLSPELISIIKSSIDDINHLYNSSTYDIFMQNLEKEGFNTQQAFLLLLLAKLGHYDYSQSTLDKCLKYYNEGTGFNLKSLEDVKDSNDEHLYDLLHERISFMKKEAVQLCIDQAPQRKGKTVAA